MLVNGLSVQPSRKTNSYPIQELDRYPGQKPPAKVCTPNWFKHLVINKVRTLASGTWVLGLDDKSDDDLIIDINHFLQKGEKNTSKQFILMSYYGFCWLKRSSRYETADQVDTRKILLRSGLKQTLLTPGRRKKQRFWTLHACNLVCYHWCKRAVKAESHEL